jgi:UDPglucose 6-dehydrogenase
MNVAVLGTWHLGSVTAACAAKIGHDVVAWDPDPRVVANLSQGRPPIAEPGLADLTAEMRAAGRLQVTGDLAEAVRAADVVWIAFDTPVDEDDRADVEFVMHAVAAAWAQLKPGALVLSSSQLPVGTVARMETACRAARRDRIGFACAPENLRLGRALDVFLHPDRIVVGVRTAEDRQTLDALFAPIAAPIEWMSVESAEMTKHAINAFLAMSVTFINELAALAEQVGADAREVERGLKTETRIGPRAYVSPGGAFTGGTLARDVAFLRALGRRVSRPTPLFDGIEAGNTAHRAWALRRLQSELGDVRGRTIAIWGLTYKPGTDTLRRSPGIDLATALEAAGARVRVHDPHAAALPEPLASHVRREDEALSAAAGADALVVATEWPEYRQIDAPRLRQAMAGDVVIDANLFLKPLDLPAAGLRLVAVGQPA